MAFADDIRSWARGQRAPVTVGLIASLVAAALILWFTQLRGFEAIAFDTDWLRQPWTLLTYPWAYMPLASPFGILGLIFLCMWLLWTSATLEKDLGPGRFVAFFLAMTALPALFVWIGALLTARVPGMHLAGGIPLLAGPWLPVAAITVAWCARNPTATISLWGIIPISGKWLAVLTVAGVLFSLGFGNPVIGVLGCVHLGIAWLYAAERLPIPYGSYRRREQETVMRGGVKVDDKYFEEVKKREQEREERERLRKLLGE